MSSKCKFKCQAQVWFENAETGNVTVRQASGTEDEENNLLLNPTSKRPLEAETANKAIKPRESDGEKGERDNHS